MNKPFIKTLASVHLIVGGSILFMWLFFYVSGSIPELETAPHEIAMHLIAEGLMALLLILSGVLLLRQSSCATSITYIAYGMLLYSVINSSGYFLSPLNIPMILMFLIIAIVSTRYIVMYAKNTS